MASPNQDLSPAEVPIPDLGHEDETDSAYDGGDREEIIDPPELQQAEDIAPAEDLSLNFGSNRPNGENTHVEGEEATLPSYRSGSRRDTPRPSCGHGPCLQCYEYWHGYWSVYLNNDHPPASPPGSVRDETRTQEHRVRGPMPQPPARVASRDRGPNPRSPPHTPPQQPSPISEAPTFSPLQLSPTSTLNPNAAPFQPRQPLSQQVYISERHLRAELNTQIEAIIAGGSSSGTSDYCRRAWLEARARVESWIHRRAGEVIEESAMREQLAGVLGGVPGQFIGLDIQIKAKAAPGRRMLTDALVHVANLMWLARQEPTAERD